jgi:formylglycine-generating enzyme required for sulfatase activity
MESEKVSSRRYLEFVNAGGYEDPALWEAGDWEWRTAKKIEHPVFWTRSESGWRYRAMFGEISLPMEWPVYVSHAEARAYARWAGKSLPTEAQWHRAAYGTREGVENPYPWGTHHPLSRRGNFDFRSWDPAPVGSFPENQSAFGVSGLLGNGWEWTSTPFGPFPGFRQFSWYQGYSANFFDDRHYVMKGGSARTAASMLRRSFRNWFQPHYQFAYAGFRCVSSPSDGE